MIAFRGTEISRDQLIASLEAHRAADRIVQGQYWVGNGDGRGCAVGCSIHDFRRGSEDDHALYEPLFGIPEALARLEDRIFEGLPVEDAREWPLRFAGAIQEGADLSRVVPALLYRIVERRRGALDGLDAAVRGLAIAPSLRDQILASTAQGREAMEQVLAVLGGWRDTGEIDQSAAETAWSAADAAGSAADIAWSAAYAARSAAYAAWSAADAARSTAYAARSAAYAAGSAAAAAGSAADAAWSAADIAKHDEYRWIAGTLIDELSRAPIVEAA